MASLLADFEYDIFISYRQKDNKGDRWVSDFVDVLRTELDKTFKEDISVYFDINPHDGILGTHDVSASLREKLRCLIFIPIVSRTYCDPKSFAWEYEFRAFVEQASRDKFGLRIKLHDGNVANRILPVIIHDLDKQDIQLCETLLGGGLRGVEFIYKEPGVNRPMLINDSEDKNLNGTHYRNQINRVANAIREIISGLKSEPVNPINLPSAIIPVTEKQALQEKSIIVLPFENISADPDQEYFSDGLTDEVISDLSHIPDLLVISRSSAMTFKRSRNTVKEIAEKVNVRYVLEGTVRRSTDNLRISAQLIDSVSDSNIWTEKYAGKLEDVFDMQEKVSQSIASALKIKLDSSGEEKIHERPINNVFAFDCYKKAYPEIISYNKTRIKTGLNLLQKGIDIAGENALMYAGMAFAYFQYVNAGIDQEENLLNAESFVRKAFRLNSNLPEAHFVMGCLCSMTGRPVEGMEHILAAWKGKPEDPEIMLWIAHAFSLIGRPAAGKPILSRCLQIDPVNPVRDSVIGWNHFYSGRFDLALKPLLDACTHAPESRMNQFWKSLILFYNNRTDDAFSFIDENVNDKVIDSWSHLSLLLKNVISKEKAKLQDLLNPEFVRIHRLDPQNSYLIAAFYAHLGKKKRAFEWLENAVERGFINYPFMHNYDPFLVHILEESKVKKLMKKVKRQWEEFEIYCK